MYDASLKSHDKITLWQTQRIVSLQTRQDALAFGFPGFDIPGDERYFYSSR